MAKQFAFAPSLASALEAGALHNFGRSLRESIADDLCVSCGMFALVFASDYCRRLYSQTGFCQACQDETEREARHEAAWEGHRGITH